MASRVAHRDYKTNHRRSMDVSKLREFAIGAVVGIAVASVVFVYVGSRHQATHESADIPHPDPHRKAPSDAENANGTGQPSEKYDFYQMLPNFEVVVPEKEKDVKRDLPATAKIERPGVYVLQAGSYRNESDADRVRDQLSKVGIDAKVQRVAVDADVWHRVRVGPITKLDELNKLRKQLQAADLDAIVIRVGD
jgi:cell division protein FtsN